MRVRVWLTDAVSVEAETQGNAHWLAWTRVRFDGPVDLPPSFKVEPIKTDKYVYCWADDFGFWHAKVEMNADEATLYRVARRAILSELRQRGAIDPRKVRTRIGEFRAGYLEVDEY